MTARKILTYPDERLREVAEPVSEFNDDLRSLVQDLIDTLEVSGGAGLAAPQIGVTKRVLVIKTESFTSACPDDSFSPGIWVLVNPKIVPSGPIQRWKEACLSVPGVGGSVARSSTCDVSYQRLDSSEHSVTVEWPLSGAVQHEADHLQGHLYIDHLGQLERAMVLKALEKRKKLLAKQVEAKHERTILELRGEKALLSYRAKRDGHGPPERRRNKQGKRFGQAK